MRTAVAMLCRFYGFSVDEVMVMTLRVFNIMLAEISEILKMENGSEDKDTREEKPLTGDAGFMVARQLFKKGNRNA